MTVIAVPPAAVVARLVLDMDADTLRADADALRLAPEELALTAARRLALAVLERPRCSSGVPCALCGDGGGR